MTPHRSLPVTIAYALALAWILGKAAAFRAIVPPGVPPDEPVHVSYVVYLEESGHLVPRYEEMKLLDAAGRWSLLPNYLGHPSVYYAALGGFGRVGSTAAAVPLDPLTRHLRRVSAPFFAVAAALFLWLGFRRAAGSGEHFVYAAAVATVPAFAFVGAAVNNDVFAYLSGGIVLLGLTRLLEGRLDALTGALTGAGLALALLSKATAGLLAILAVAGVLALLAARSALPRRRGLLLAFLPWLALPAFHFFPVLLRYGTPVPTLEVVDPAAFARSAFVSAPGWEILPLATWGAKVLKLLASTWLSIASHVWFPVGPVWSLAGPALLLGLAGFGLATSRWGSRAEDRPALDLERVGAAAVLLTLLVNLAWSRAGYLRTGFLGGVHARYYLPFLPCLALAAAAGFRRLRARTWLAAALALLLVLFDLDVTVRYLALFES